MKGSLEIQDTVKVGNPGNRELELRYNNNL